MRFNTQPPEGGWFFDEVDKQEEVWFQHTAARRRLGQILWWGCLIRFWFQHTAARRRLDAGESLGVDFESVSTHSRPKAAGLASF